MPELSTELQSLLNRVAAGAARACGADDATIWVVEGDALHQVAHAGPIDPTTATAVPLKAPTEASYALRGLRTFHVADVLADEGAFGPGATERFRARGVRTMLLAPLVIDATLVGRITIRRREVRPFADDEIAQLETYAELASVALNQARVAEERDRVARALEEQARDLRAALDRQTATSEILQIISGSPTDVTPVYEAIAQAAARVLDAPSVSVWVKEGNSVRVVADIWPADRPLDSGRPVVGQIVALNGAPGRGPSPTAIAERRTVHVPDREAAAAVYAGVITRPESPRSALSAPMWRNGEPVGAVAVHRFEARAFSPAEIALLETFAAQAVIAMENARLFHELEAKNAELEVASKHKSDFLSQMSHELRTPLNAVISFSEMLHEDATDNGHDDYLPDLQEITTAGKHLLGLINDILDLAKVEAGRMDVIMEEFSIPNLVHEVQAMAEPLVHKYGNAFVVQCPDDLGTMTSDVTKIRQGLLNLLSNAAKFTEQGTITLDVARDASGLIHFTVTDTGIGMTAEQIGRLFEAFSQAEAGTSRKYGGTGLGLAITRRFCQMLGGDVTVTSQAGTGSTFTITLPVRAPSLVPWES